MDSRRHPRASADSGRLDGLPLMLSGVALTGAAVASLVILGWSGSFPDPTADPGNRVLAEARGWSAVTLGVAVLGAAAVVSAARGSLRGLALAAGVLAYLVYTFLELAVSPPYSALYLVYVAVLATALPALVATVSRVGVGALAEAFGDRAPRRLVGGFAVVFGVLLALAWLGGIVERTVAGAFGWPQGADAVAHVVHALDLGLQVPLALAAGFTVLRREPVGYLVGSIFLVMAASMGPALTAMVAVASVDAGASPVAAAPFAVLAAIAIGLAVTWFRAMRLA